MNNNPDQAGSAGKPELPAEIPGVKPAGNSDQKDMAASLIGKNKKPVQPDENSSSYEQHLFDFFKRYLGLIATISGAPLVVSALGILKPPKIYQDYSATLSGLASLACLVVLSIVISCRRYMVEAINREKRVIGIYPFLLALFFVVGGLFTGGCYIIIESHLQKGIALHFWALDFTHLGFWAALCYLVTMPSFTAAMGIATMGAYNEFNRAQLEKQIDEALRSPSDRELMRTLVSRYSELRSRQERLGSDTVVRRLLQHLVAKATEIVDGKLMAVGDEINELKRDLMLDYPSGYRGVSFRQMEFWAAVVGQTSGSEDLAKFARHFLRLEADHPKEGKTKPVIERIFVLSASELDSCDELLVEILRKHWSEGIEFGIASYEELPRNLDGTRLHLNFCFFGEFRVLGFISDISGAGRRARFLFDATQNEQVISDYWEQWKALHAQCLIVSQGFKSTAGGQDVTLVQAMEDMGTASVPLNYAAKKQVRLNNDREIRPSLNLIRRLLLHRSAAWNKEESKMLATLLGRWDYEFTGNSPGEDGQVRQQVIRQAFGNCQFYQSGSRILARGERTAQKIGDGELIPCSAKWTSQPIRLITDPRDNKMKLQFDYTPPNTEGCEDRPVNVSFNHMDNGDMKGEISASWPGGAALSGQIIFSRGALG